MTTSRNKLVLVDADHIAFKAASSCEPTKLKPEREPEYAALGRAADICNRIGDRTQGTEFRFYLGGDKNFRKIIYPDYKANRADRERPLYLESARQYLVRKWGAIILTEPYEVDDRVAIESTENPDAIIVSLDKDLKQLAATHYNFKTDIFEVVTEQMAAINFYTQMLVGDVSDNLAGIRGLGPVKAGRILSGCTPEEAHLRVLGVYKEHGQDFDLAYRLFRLLRSVEEWNEVKSEIEFSESQRQEVAADSTGQVACVEAIPDTQ